MTRIPFVSLRPDSHLLVEMVDASIEVLRGGQYLQGWNVREFEREWAGYVGAKHCVAVGSGSEALRLLAGVRPWHVAVKRQPHSPYTRKALEGSECALVQVDSWEQKRWQAAVVVHLHGIPNPDFPRKGFVIEDCCQAHGARLDGRMCGTFGRAAAWSFYPTKNLGGYGDGGAVTTDSDDVAEQVRAHPSARMDELQAAFLRLKLRRLEAENEVRRAQAEVYLGALPIYEPGVILPVIPPGAEPCWHHFVIQTARRDDLKAFLTERGIETMVHYPPDPKVLSLPIGPHLGDDDIWTVVEAIGEWGHRG